MDAGFLIQGRWYRRRGRGRHCRRDKGANRTPSAVQSIRFTCNITAFSRAGSVAALNVRRHCWLLTQTACRSLRLHKTSVEMDKLFNWKGACCSVINCPDSPSGRIQQLVNPSVVSVDACYSVVLISGVILCCVSLHLC